MFLKNFLGSNPVQLLHVVEFFFSILASPKSNKNAWQMRMKPCLPFRYNILFTECTSIVVKNKNAAVLIKCLPSYELERNEPSPLCARWKSCFNFHFLYLIMRCGWHSMVDRLGNFAQSLTSRSSHVTKCLFYHRRGLSQRKERRITE